MIEQRTDEWKEQRRGLFTASEIHRLMGAKGLGKTGESYIMEKVAETLGAWLPEVSTKAMEHGILTEPFAKLQYEREYNCQIQPAPFIVATWNDQAGCSPDGFVTTIEDVRGIEVKCPYDPTNHIRHLLIKDQQQLKAEKPEYYWQIMMSMAVTGLSQWDFVSYCDEFQNGVALSRLEITADQSEIDLLKSRIAEAAKIKDEIIQKIIL